MKEYIEKGATIKRFTFATLDCLGMEPQIRASDVVKAIEAIPAADVVEVRHGRWIDDKVSFYLGCSECGCFLEYAVDTFLDYGGHYNYCPNCGAKMDGGADDAVD